MSIVSKINSLNYRLNEIFDVLPDIAKDQYMRKSLIDEIHYTNQIEGVVYTRKDINDLITEIEKNATCRNRLEGIVNKYLMMTNEKINLVDSKDIRKLYDGNGRVNRFISSYILSKYYNKVVGFRLSMTIKENLSQYLDAFNHTNDVRNKADVSTFVYEFLDIIYKSFQKTELYTLEKMQQFNKYKTKIDSVSKLYENNKNKNNITNLLLVLIQCSIFGDFGLNKTKLIKILKKGSTKVSEYLGILKQLNLCLDIQSGKNHYFKCNLEELDLYE